MMSVLKAKRGGAVKMRNGSGWEYRLKFPKIHLN